LRFTGPDSNRFIANWKGYLEWKAKRSHTIMAWCGVALFPAFSLLDYLVIEQWKLFVGVRIGGSLLIVIMLLSVDYLKISGNMIAHISSQVIIQILMWMLSQMQTAEQFFIYSLNTSTAYIASAIFLLWHPRHSILLAATTVLGFVFFHVAFSEMTFGTIVSSGTLPLLTIVIMSQLFVNHKYRITYRDFIIQAELNEANRILQEKNHEIRNQNNEITSQKESLQELNQLKDRLLMIISHDVKSPLASLKGLLQLIHDYDSVSPEDFRNVIKGLRHQLDKTYDFLEGLLMWCKSQMNGFQVKRQNVNVRLLVETSTELLQSISQHKGVSLINQVDDSLQVVGDEDMLRLVVRNLTANAIKFTNSGGSVGISAKDVGDDVAIVVQDNGIGMDPSELKKLFNAKNPFHKHGTNLEKGTGLGLMLCKDFVEKNGGELHVASLPGALQSRNALLPTVLY
jgi:signal transduction histidine kinase